MSRDSSERPTVKQRMGPAEHEIGTDSVTGQASVTVAVDAGDGGDAGPKDAELDEMLDEAMKGVVEPAATLYAGAAAELDALFAL
jgi:hypothetical protein